MSGEPALALREVTVEFRTASGAVRVVDGVDLQVAAGECLAVVGESGSGKSQLFLACLGLLESNGQVRGSARVLGEELIGAPEHALRRLRGARIATVFQDPMNALTPHLRIGAQLVEMLRVHRGLTVPDAHAQAIAALRRVGIPDAPVRIRQYPHEFSGGMRQRVAIAMALSAEPAVLIADEPTTALDVTVQARIVELLRSIVGQGLGLVLITHDLGVVAGIADRVAVMYAGRIVETGPVRALYASPRHPYTQALLGAVPRLDAVRGQSLRTIEGRPPVPGQVSPGCAFAPRCPQRMQHCTVVRPTLTPIAGGAVACHLVPAPGAP